MLLRGWYRQLEKLSIRDVLAGGGMEWEKIDSEQSGERKLKPIESPRREGGNVIVG